MLGVWASNCAQVLHFCLVFKKKNFFFKGTGSYVAQVALWSPNSLAFFPSAVDVYRHASAGLVDVNVLSWLLVSFQVEALVSFYDCTVCIWLLKQRSRHNTPGLVQCSLVPWPGSISCQATVLKTGPVCLFPGLTFLLANVILFIGNSCGLCGSLGSRGAL